MSVSHPLAVRQYIADYVVDQLDDGFIELQTAGGVEVATLSFGATAFGAADGSAIATANSITADTNAAGNASDITKGELQNSGTNPIVLFSVSSIVAGTGDVQLSSVNVAAGDTVSMSVLTYTAPN